MCIELKIKAKHLALEPGIIRLEERKLKAQIKYLKKKSLEGSEVLNGKLSSLILHRRTDVRNEARATLLARTYLAGKPYTFSEKKRREDREGTFQYHILPRISAMIRKYGSWEQRRVDEKVTLEKIREWAKI